MIIREKPLLFLLIRGVSFAFIFNVIAAYPLWLPEFRTFPQINASPINISFSNFQRYFIIALALVSLFVANMSLRYYRAGIGVFFSIFVLFVFEDINRLQPYFYFYAWIFIIIVLHIKDAGLTNIRHGLFLLFGACYLWSGVYKCNTTFPNGIFLLVQKTDIELLNKISPSLFYLIPFIEILLGVEFLELAFRKGKKTNKLYLFIAIFLHLSISAVLWLSGWNKIVISWNLCMIFVLVFLFEAKCSSINNIRHDLKKHLFVAFFVAFLPAFHLFGYWDSYLSWRLYTGITTEGKYYLKKIPQTSVPKKLIENYKIIFFDVREKQYYIDIRAWLLAETHTYFYPEKRYFEKFGEKIEQYEK